MEGETGSEQRSSELLLFTLVEIAKDRGDPSLAAVCAGADLDLDFERYDNWNGGLYRVHIKLSVDARLYAKLPPAERERLATLIREEADPLLDLTDNESIGKVALLPRPKSVPVRWREEERARLRGQGVPNLVVDGAEGESVRIRYEVGEKIGYGAFGSVHRAVRTSDAANFEHAVKFLDPSPFISDSNSNRARDRFKREVAAVQRLQHRGIVSYVDAGIDEQNRPYLVMPLIEGKRLHEAAQARPLERRPWLMVQVLEAVAYAHGLDVLHRDLKPSNILVRASDDQPIIVDWGLAYLFEEASSATLTTSAVGSIGYIPSEVLADPKLHTPQHDVFACGVILYELLAGKRPVPDDYQPLARVAQNLEKLDPIIRQAIAPARRRYPTASALYGALRPVAVELHNRRK